MPVSFGRFETRGFGRNNNKLPFPPRRNNCTSFITVDINNTSELSTLPRALNTSQASRVHRSSQASRVSALAFSLPIKKTVSHKTILMSILRQCLSILSVVLFLISFAKRTYAMDSLSLAMEPSFSCCSEGKLRPSPHNLKIRRSGSMSNNLVDVTSDPRHSKSAAIYTPAHSPCLSDRASSPKTLRAACTTCRSDQGAAAEDEVWVFTRLQTQLYPTIRF